MRPFEVFLHGRAGLEEPVTEIHGEYDVDGFDGDRHDVIIMNMDAFAGSTETRDPVAPAPVKHPGVQIHAMGNIVVAAFYPFTGGVGGAAEILAQVVRDAVPEFLKGLVDEIDLRFHALHGPLVQIMFVRGLGHGASGLVLLFLFGHAACPGVGVLKKAIIA